MRKILLYSLVLFSFTVLGQSWKDQKVESFFTENNFNDAEKHIENKLASETTLTKEQSVYYFAKLSHVYLRKGQFDKALDFARKSVSNSKPITDKLLISETWRAMSFAYIRAGNLDSALVYSERMYLYAKETDNYDFKRASLMAIGNISMQQEKYTNALKFYGDVVDLTKNNKITTTLKVDYYNLGLAYSMLKKYEKSNNYLELAIAICDDEVLLARIYGTLMENYSKLNNNPKRIYYQQKAINIAEKNNNIQALAMGYSNMMEWSLNENNPTKAIEYGKITLNYLKKYPLKQLEVRVDSLMYKALKNSKRNEEALVFLESYTKEKKKIISTNSEKRLDELIVKYDVENKNLKIKNQEIQLINANRERKIYLLIMAILLLLIVSFVVFKVNRKIYKKLLFKKDKYYDNLFFQTKSLFKQDYLNNPYIANQDANTIKTENLFTMLINTMEEKQLFLNPELDQKTLIRILGTNKKYLYEAIKLHGESNFRGIINRLRLNHAKKIIAENIASGQSTNFGTLYMASGFNSNSTFYRIFKSYTGLSPIEYSIEYKNDLNKKNIKST